MRKRILAAIVSLAILVSCLPPITIGAYTYHTQSDISTSFEYVEGIGVVANDRGTQKPMDEVFEVYDFSGFNLNTPYASASFDYDNTSFTSMTAVTNEFTPYEFKPEAANKRAVKVYHFPDFKLTNTTTTAEDTIIAANNYLSLSDKDSSGSRLLLTTKEQPTNTKRVSKAVYTYLKGEVWGGDNTDPLIPIYVDAETGKGFFVSLYMNTNYTNHGINKWKYESGAYTKTREAWNDNNGNQVYNWYEACKPTYGVGGSLHCPMVVTVTVEYTYDGDHISEVAVTERTSVPNDPGKYGENPFTFTAEDIRTEAGLEAGTVLAAENAIPGMVSNAGGTNVNITDISVSFSEEKNQDTCGPVSTNFKVDSNGKVVVTDEANNMDVAMEDMFAVYNFSGFNLNTPYASASFDYDNTSFTSMTAVTNEFTPYEFKPEAANKRAVKVYHFPDFKLKNTTTTAEDTIIAANNYLTLSDKDSSGSRLLLTTKEQPTNTKRVSKAVYTYLKGEVWGTTTTDPLIPIYVDSESGKGFFVSASMHTDYKNHGILEWKYADGAYTSTVNRWTDSEPQIYNWYEACKPTYGVGGSLHCPIVVTVTVEYTYDGDNLSQVKVTERMSVPNDTSIYDENPFTFNAEDIRTKAGLEEGTALYAKNAIPGMVSNAGGTNVNISGISIAFTQVKDLMTDHKALMENTANGTTLDRTGKAYQAFLADYSVLDANAKADLKENSLWTQFTAAAKEDLGLYGGDDFSDVFYTDLMWEQRLETADLSTTYTTAVEKEFGISDGKLSISGVDVSTDKDKKYLVGKPINYANTAYLSFDLTYTGTGTELYIYADQASQTYVRFNVDNLGAMKFNGGIYDYAVNYGDSLLNVNRDNTVYKVGQDAATLTGLSANVPYTLYVKYEQVGDNIQMTVTLLNSNGRPLSTESFQLAGTLTSNGWFGYRALFDTWYNNGKTGTLLDNLKVYESAQTMDFNVKYGNLLAADPARVTPYLYQTDIVGMIADYEALTNTADVDSRYEALAAAGQVWNVQESEYANTFKTVHSAALSTSATLEEVECAISVYNALDVAVKNALTSEYAALKEKLQDLGQTAADKTKIAFVGSSFFDHDVQKDAASTAENVANIFMNTLDPDGSDYEYLKLGISGIKLLDAATFDSYTGDVPVENPNLVTCFESYTFYQYLLEYNPDVVVVALGINNLYGRTTALSGAQKDALHRAYKRLVQTLEALPAAPTVILMTPYCTAYDTSDAKLTYTAGTQECLQAAREAIIQVQEETGCGMIDNYEFTANFTDSEMDYYYDRGNETGNGQFDDISQNGMGASDGVHGSWALQKAYADYWVKTFFSKTTEVLATNSIRILDHSFADNAEKYLGLSWSGVSRSENGEKVQYIAPLEDGIRATVKDKFTAEQQAILLAESAPSFGAVANAINAANSALTFHVKFDNSAFEAFGVDYQYGLIAIPGQATEDTDITVSTVSKEGFESTKLLDVNSTLDGATNMYVKLNGTESANLKGVRILAKAYVCYDADGDGQIETSEYLYSEQKSCSVNATRRSVAQKMITRAYKKFFAGYADMDYTALGVDGITTGTLSEDNFNRLIDAVVTSKTASSDAVYQFLKNNYNAYHGGRTNEESERL